MKRRAKQTSARRLTVILSALVIALALVGSMAAMAIAADTVETRDSWQSGNASFECAQAGCTFSEFAYKVEPWDAGDPSGTYSAPGGASISITARGSGGEYKSFDWSISDGFVVHCVIVKAGTGALIYRYGEDGATSDGGLQGYQGKAVSHATFCYSKVTPQTGTLEITKEIVDAPDDTWGPEDFSITVTGPDPATAQVYSGAFDATTGKVTLTGLALGTYTITEQDPGANWTVDITADGVATVEADKKTTVEVTNTYKAPAPQTGSLEITKTIVDAPDDTWGPEDFSITVTGPDSKTVFSGAFDATTGKVTLTGLALGTYTITEQDPGANWTVDITADGVATVEADKKTTVEVTNTYKAPAPQTGSLEITKTIVDAPDDTWGPEDFSITVTGPDSKTVFSGAFDATTGKVTLTGLALGTYTITEQDPGANWTVDITADGVATVEADKKTTVEVTNTYKAPAPQTGSLEITKTIVDAPDDTWGPEDFSITVTGPDSKTVFSGAFDATTGKVTLTGLALGTYTITEQDPGANWTVDITADGVATVEADKKTTVEVTNTYKAPAPQTGSLEITKVLNDPTGRFTTDEFQVHVTGPDQFNQVQKFSGGKVVLTGLTPGTYTVTEVGLPPAAGFEVTIDPAGPVNVSAGGVTYVKVTNSRTVTSPVTTDPNDTTTTSSSTTSSTTTTVTEGPVDEPTDTTSSSTTDTTGPVVDEETTVPSSSSTTAVSTVQNQTTVPVPSGIIQTGGGGTAERGNAGVWALAALAAALGVGVLITSLRVKPGAK